MATAPTISRTDWAEREVEHVLSLPLISEFVFRSPKHNDPNEKEVIDHLIVHKDEAILISQKAQDDPTKRSVQRNELWVLKNTQDALKPILGAIRKPGDRPKWCEHSRRGRIAFEALPKIIRGIALAETWRPVDLQTAAANLPLEYLGVPLSYLSINDFLNLVVQLRTVPEALAYLDARRSLPANSLRVIGNEFPLFELYLMNGGNLRGCTGHADAERATSTHDDLVQEAINRNSEYQHYSSCLEHVAHALAGRDPDYKVGATSEMLALFDPLEQRQNYIVLQEILADLRLRERAELGRGFDALCERMSRQGRGMSSCAAHLDGRDWVFVFISSRGREKAAIFNAATELTGAALAHYQKRNCFVIVDCDGEHYDVL